MKKKVPCNAPNSILKIFKASGFILVLALLSLNFGQAQNDNANENATVDGGVISTTDETTVCVGDGVPDYIDVTVTGESGRVKQWIITDLDGNILDLPDSPPFDFEEAPPGNCLIWHLSYNGIKPLVDPSGQKKFTKNIHDIVGRYDLSNSIEVERIQQPEAGEIEIAGGGTEIEICAGDGVSDAFDVIVSGAEGGNTVWVITDDQLNILALPAGPPFDLEGAGEGICLIWHLRYEIGITGAEVGSNAADLEGCFDLSNPITVTRKGVGGGELELAGGGTEITICTGDGISDPIDVTVTGVAPGPAAWVITDDQANILALPAGPPFDLEGAGEGTCLIWHLSYEDGLEGAAVGNNAATDLVGCFDLSNPITVIRNGVDGGAIEITGGGTEITICAGDGVSDAFDVTLTGAAPGPTAWVITDDQANILALPEGPPFDLEGAGDGVCLIWHLSYEEGLEGAAVGNNAAADLVGCFDLSNPITVTRNGVAGGVLSRTDGSAEPFTFTVGDNVADFIPEGAITLEGNIGTNSQWVVTDEAGTILGLPASPYEVDFEGAGAGTCLIWHLSFEDGLEGAAVDANAADLVGCFSLSNPLTVIRNSASGRIAIYPNPTDRIVNIDLSGLNTRNISISVFNFQNVLLSNRTLDTRDFTRSQITSLNLDGYSRGIYFVRVIDNTNEKTYLKRLIVN
jgi:hypothetical protein